MRTTSDAWLPFRWFDDLRRDAAYAVRSLLRSPGFTTAAVLTLSVGIGATTAIYSVVDTILLQPLPFPDSDRLVRVVENITSVFVGRPLSQRGVGYREFLEWRTRTRTLSDTTAVMSLGQRIVRTNDGVARLWGAMTSGNTFGLLGAHAMVGRTLGGDDEANPNVVVLSFDVWRRLFHSDTGVIGTAIEFRAPEATARLLTVVGVMPEDFAFPTGAIDFYTPVLLEPAAQRSASVTMIGRLSPGVSLATARDEANVIGSAVRPPRPANAPQLTVLRFDVQRLKDRLVQGMRPALRVLLAAVAVVLMIVCANVANLLLARATARQHEMAVRFAIGAGRGRIVRQILTESLVLAGAGGALGALLGAVGVTLVKRLATVEAPGIFKVVPWSSILPRGNEVGVDLKMLGIAFGIAAITSLVFGVLPALHVSRANLLHVVGPRSGGGSHGDTRLRSALVVGQLVMATVLLIGAGLLMTSFVKLSTVKTGYDPSNVVAVQLVFPADHSIARKAESIGLVLDRLRALPDVEAAGFSRAGMLIGEEINVGTFVPPGRTFNEMRTDPVKPRVRSVSAGFLTAMGIPVLAGREFAATDTAGAPPMIVMNRSAARHFFGARSAAGEFVDWYVGQTRTQVQVAGVVEEVRNESLAHEPVPEIFVEYRQLLSLQQVWGDPTRRQDELAIGFLSFAVRTKGDPAAAIPTIARIVRSVDPNAGIDAILPMERLVASSLARERFYAVLLGIFAGVAGFLAAIGVYGVLAYAVMQRTREIGIRMALGARRAQVLALILRRGLILAAVGIALGLVGAVAGARYLQGMLFGITPLNLTTFAVVSVLFGLVAAFACYMPARRATKVDPIAALRTE